MWRKTYALTILSIIRALRIYQSGYGQKGSFTFRIGDEEVVLAEQETLEKENLVFKVVRFESEVHNFGPGVQIVYLEGDEPKTTWFLQNIERLRSQTIQGVNIQLIDISENPYTSLEVTSDPGVFVVWTGFALDSFRFICNVFYLLPQNFYCEYRKRSYYGRICLEEQRDVQKGI